MGAGAVGRALAAAWLRAGHDVALGVRDRSSRTAELAVSSFGVGRVTDIASAVAAADAALVAIPGAAVHGALPAIAGELDGKLVIDASNNIQAPVRNSLAEIEAAAPRARRYRAFNSLPVATLSDPDLAGIRPDLFFAGRDNADRPTVERLIREAGLRPVYVGGLEWAPVVDAPGGLSFALGRTRPGQRLALNLVSA